MATSVQLMCPNLKCRRVLAVPEATRGKVVRCMHCQQTFRVPEGRKKVAPVDTSK